MIGLGKSEEERKALSSTARQVIFWVLIIAGALLIYKLVNPGSRNTAPIDLTATEFDILMCLVRAPGRVLTREAIRDDVWGPGHHGTPRTIDNFILQLRAKLEDDPTEPRHIVTVRGVGYRFVV